VALMRPIYGNRRRLAVTARTVNECAPAPVNPFTARRAQPR